MDQINNSDILDFFSKRIEDKSGSSVKEYKKAYIYLANFLSATDNSFVNPSIELLEDWCIILYSYGLTAKTVAHYVDIVSALYTAAVKEGLVAHNGAFKAIKAKLKNGDLQHSIETVSEQQFVRLQNLALLSSRLDKEIALYIDLFVVSILTGCRSLLEVALLKKADINAVSEQVATILERYAEPTRKYVFPLLQSERTPRQLESHVEAKIVALLNSRGIHIGKSVLDTARNFWTHTAIKCGIAPSEISAVLSGTPSSKAQTETIKSVGEAFMSNPANWYAMKLRRGVKINGITERLAEIEEYLRPIETFYPCTETLRKENKKMVKELTPVIPDVLFFKSRMTDVRSLFAKIGDLSWCYRRANGTGEYAVIARSEMEHFQRAIGQFSSDYEVGPIGFIQPKEGDKIKVIGGIFGGNEGELLKVMEQPEEGTIYRLKIIDEQGIEWRVGIDPRHTALQ